MVDNSIFKLMKSFSGSFLNQHGEFIAHEKANEYFRLSDCKNELEIKCKILEWFSRGAYKTEPFRGIKKNKEFNEFMLNGINLFLGTNFEQEQITIIYQELGNRVDRALTIKFIENNYDLKILTQED